MEAVLVEGLRRLGDEGLQAGKRPLVELEHFVS